MVRSVLAAALLAAIILASCTPSQVAPDADITIVGGAADAAGAPLADTLVQLTVDPGPGIIFWLPFVIGTFGAACLTDLCGAEHETTTDRDGAYRFELTGRDVQGGFGEEVDLLLGFTGRPPEGTVAGASARATLVVRRESTVIPRIELWEPAVDLTPDGAVGWSALATMLGVPDRYEAVFQTGAGFPIWSQVGGPEGTTVDPRVLEDAAGAVAGVGHLQVQAPEGLRSVSFRTPSLAFRSLAGPPVSRGAPCTALTSAGTRVDTVPCRATDGVLSEPVAAAIPCDAEAACEQVTALEVDVAAARPVDLVVVRGCPECALTLDDGAPVRITEALAAIQVESPVPVARLVLQGDLSDLTEVSVWDGPPAGGLERIAALPGAGSSGAGGGADSGVPVLLLLLAAFLVGVTFTALLNVVAFTRPR